MTELPKRPSRLWLTRSRRVIRCEFVWLVRFIFGQTTCENIKTNWAKQTNFTLRERQRGCSGVCVDEIRRSQALYEMSLGAKIRVTRVHRHGWSTPSTLLRNWTKDKKIQRKSDETRPSKSWRAQNNLTNLELNRFIQEIENAKKCLVKVRDSNFLRRFTAFKESSLCSPKKRRILYFFVFF